MPKRNFTVTVAFFLIFVCLLAAIPAQAAGVQLLADRTKAEGSAATRILVLGRDASKKLTDSMFLLTVDPRQKLATVLQIPRDTYFEYTDRDYKKINGALTSLGAQALLETLSASFGVPIRYFCILDLDGVDSMVDAIGGVDLYNPVPMHYVDSAQNLEIDIPQGQIHLDGKQAEHFVRYRAGYADADLGRLDAQKLFLKALGQKCQVCSPFRLLSLLASVLTSVQTNLGFAQAVTLFASLESFPFEELPSATVPGQAAYGSSGASYYVLNREGAARAVNEFLLPTTPITLAEFDPNGLFDREEHSAFHKIYIASEGDLPIS
ncbi:MAG: LCP family protein [Clostridia bacterium]|nr:LCP family protein [Clostridia bacterium]